MIISVVLSFQILKPLNFFLLTWHKYHTMVGGGAAQNFYIVIYYNQEYNNIA